MDDMTRYLILYLACAAIFFPADFVWLTLSSKNLYRKELGDLLLEQPNLIIAAAFYLAYVAGLVILVAAPAEGDVVKALLDGRGARLCCLRHLRPHQPLDHPRASPPRSQQSIWPGEPPSVRSPPLAEYGSPAGSPDLRRSVGRRFLFRRDRRRLAPALDQVTLAPHHHEAAPTMMAPPISAIGSIRCPNTV